METQTATKVAFAKGSEMKRLPVKVFGTEIQSRKQSRTNWREEKQHRFGYWSCPSLQQAEFKTKW